MTFETQAEIDEVLNIIKSANEQGIFFLDIFKKCKLVYEKSMLARILHNQIELATVNKNNDNKYIYANLASEKLNEEIKKLLANNEIKEMSKQLEKEKPKVIVVHRKALPVSKDDSDEQEEAKPEKKEIKVLLNADLTKNSIMGKAAFIFYLSRQLNKNCHFLCAEEITTLLNAKKLTINSTMHLLKQNKFIEPGTKVGKKIYYRWSDRYKYPFFNKDFEEDKKLLTKYTLDYITNKTILNKHTLDVNHIIISESKEPENKEIEKNTDQKSDSLGTSFDFNKCTIPVLTVSEISKLHIKDEIENFLDFEINNLELKLRHLKQLRENHIKYKQQNNNDKNITI